MHPAIIVLEGHLLISLSRIELEQGYNSCLLLLCLGRYLFTKKLLYEMICVYVLLS